jgi:hypothetical protein
MKSSSVRNDAHVLNDEPHSTPTWDDSTISLSDRNAEIQPLNSRAPGEAWERRDKAVAHDITDGVTRIRHSTGAWTMNEADVFIDVWEDLRRSAQREGGEATWIAVAAACKARWWRWAKDETQERPIPPQGWSAALLKAQSPTG